MIKQISLTKQTFYSGNKYKRKLLSNHGTSSEFFGRNPDIITIQEARQIAFKFAKDPTNPDQLTQISEALQNKRWTDAYQILVNLKYIEFSSKDEKT